MKRNALSFIAILFLAFAARQEYNLSFTPTHVLIAIEDSEGVYDNLPFCNTIESLPQEQNTGRYYLL